MKRTKFQLIQTSCKRCGKPLVTGSRSLYGMDEAKAKYDRICQQCMTPEEHHELLNLLKNVFI
jgi:RNase P subunit RPR2